MDTLRRVNLTHLRGAHTQEDDLVWKMTYTDMRSTSRLGMLIPRGMMVDENMGLFGKLGPRRGVDIHLGDLVGKGEWRFIWKWVCEGKWHPQRTWRFMMVTFWEPIREKGCINMEGKFWKDTKTKIDLRFRVKWRGGSPSRSQVTPHGRTCDALRRIQWTYLGKLLLGIFWLSIERKVSWRLVWGRTEIYEVSGNKETNSMEMKRQQVCGWRHILGALQMVVEMIVMDSLGDNLCMSVLVRWGESFLSCNKGGGWILLDEKWIWNSEMKSRIRT